MKRKKVTQAEADELAVQNEDFLHSREYSHGSYEAQTGEKADFENKDISELKFVECFFDEVNFKNAKLHATEFRYCSFDSAHFYEADLEGAVFYGCTLDRANLVYANCRNAQFVDCNIRDTSLSHADLRNTEFLGSDLENSDLKNVKINRRSNPEKFRNVNTDGIINNSYVKRWLERQAYIAEFKAYHPVLAWFWKWGSDYGRSAWVLIAWYVVATLLFGSIYSFTDIFYFDSFSWLSGYLQAGLMMIPFGYARVLPYDLPGQVLLLSQAVLAYLLLILIGVMIVNRFRH